MIACNAIPDGVLAWGGRRRVGLIHSRWEQRRRARPHESRGGRRQRGTRLLLHTDLQFCSFLHQTLPQSFKIRPQFLFFGHLTPTLPNQFIYRTWRWWNSRSSQRQKLRQSTDSNAGVAGASSVCVPLPSLTTRAQLARSLNERWNPNPPHPE